jgi:hypothetical protein
MDAEGQPRSVADAEKGGFVRAGKMPLPLRRKYVFSDVLKIMLCFAILAYGNSLLAVAFSYFLC